MHLLTLFWQVFSVWHHKFNNEKEDRRQERLAAQHYKKMLFDKCFRSMRFYAAYRHKKAVQKQKLAEYADSQLVYKIFQVWSQRFEARQRMHLLVAQTREFSERFLVARVFNFWENGKLYNSYNNFI